MYNSLHEQTNQNCLAACRGALIITTVIYTIIALLGMFFFGSVVDQNILNNVAKEEGHWESYVMRVIFAVVLACHVPFIFFSGKESLLIIIDEYNRKSISKVLQDKAVGQLASASEPVEDINDQLNADANTTSSSRRSTMAYKEMSYVLYFLTTVGFYVLQIIGSIVLTDIGLIFEFISAVAISNLAFILPGLFYLLAEEKYAHPMQKDMNKSIRIEAKLFVFLGVVAFIVQLTSNIIGIVKGGDH